MALSRRTLTWLHLSDLHRCSTRDGGAGEIVLRRLIEDLEALRDEHGLRPDLLFMTGDLAFGQIREQPLDEQLREGWCWLDKIRELYELGVENVFLVPGNHDVDRGEVTRATQSWLRDLATGYKNDEIRDLLATGGREWQDYMKRLTCFESFIAEHCPHLADDGGHCIYSVVRKVAGLRVGVAGFNSAWSCGPDDDKGNLWLGEWQLDTLTARLLDAADVRIALVHHPLGWLVEAEAAQLKPRFQTEFNVFLHGHEHHQWVETPQKEHLHVAAGAIFDRGDSALGYNVVRFDLEKEAGEVWLRCLDHDTKKWMAKAVPDMTDTRGVWPVKLPWKIPDSRPDAPFAEGGRGDLKKGGWEDVRPHDDFLSRIEAVCKLREGERALIERKDTDSGMSYLSVQCRDGGIIRDFAVTAADDVTAETLDAFLGVLRRYQRLDPGGVSILVCREPPAADLVARAGRSRVQLVTFLEYQGLIDFHAYVAGQTRKLAADPVYNPRHYVPQCIRYRFAEEDHEGDAIDTVTGWLEDIRGRFVLVLGDFGTGKTFLLHELARRLSEAGGPLTPVLIEMCDLEKGRSLDELAAQHFARAGMDRLEFKAFRYMLREGRVVLLFDGFDELALRVTYDRATEHFDTLVEAAGGNAKVVVTSRTQHFETDAQVRTVLGDRVGQLAGHRIIHLRKFDETQIRDYLDRRLDDPEAAEQRFELIRRIRDLMGLSEVPRMLGFIADLPEEDLLAAEEKRGAVRAADLYQLLLERWLVHEVERLKPKGGKPTLTEDQRWEAVDKLALRLWQRTERSVNVSEIAEEAAALETLANSRIGTDVATHQVGSGTLLVRDAEGAFSFIHQSVLEWLIARRTARELRETGSSKTLSLRTLSPLMAEFLRDLVGLDKAKRWTEEALEYGRGTVRQNALIVRDRLEAIGARLGTVLHMAGEDLRGKSFSGKILDGSDFTGADLTAAKLVESSLRKARLSGTKLVDADLSRIDLRDADLRGADLSSARLLGADLRGADLRRSTLWRTKLVGAHFAEDAFVATRLFGAALSEDVFQPWKVSSTSRPRSVSWHPAQEILAAGHENGTLRLWDTASGYEITLFSGHQGRVLSVCFSPDGSLLASGSADKTVRLWDLAASETSVALHGHQASTWSVCFNPDGSLLASGSADKTVRLWDVAAGETTAILRGHQGRVWSVCFSPDGSRLASASSDRTVRLWDVAAGETIATLHGHLDEVNSVCFSPDGSRLASASHDETVRLWDAVAGGTIAIFQGHQDAVWSVCFTTDGSQIASGSGDKTVRLWDVAAIENTATLHGHQAAIWSVCFSPDGSRLASGSNDTTVRLWDLATGEATATLHGYQATVYSVCFSPDGSRLASASQDKTVRLWDLATSEATATLHGHQAAIWSVCFSPDGSRLASGSHDKTVRLWDLATGELAAVLHGHQDHVLSVCFSPNGSRLASGASDKTVRLWDLATGESTAVLHGHKDLVLSVCFSPDGSRLASGSPDKTVRLWDLTAGETIAALQGHQDLIWSVCFSPDGSRLASGSGDKTVRLWDVNRDETTATLHGHQAPVWSVCFSPDGSQLASASSDGTVRLWDVAAGEATGTLRGHRATVSSVCFSPDGSRLASGSSDGTVRLWDAGSGCCLTILVPLPEGWVVYTPDGRYKLGGETTGMFWHSIGLCRFEPGELDPYLDQPLRVPDGEPFF